MHFLRSIALTIWTFWCGLVFAICCLIAFPILWLGLHFGGKCTELRMHLVAPFVARICLFLWGIRVRQHNAAIIDAKRQYVFIFNHRSYLDPMIAAAVIRQPLKFIGKAEILKWPGLGFLMRKLYIPVKRDDREQRKIAFDQLFVKFLSGCSMVVMPEGTTNREAGSLLPFKDGAFALAAESRSPLAVGVMIDPGRLWSRERILIRPGYVDLYWLKVYEGSALQKESIEELKQEIREEMLHVLQDKINTNQG